MNEPLLRLVSKVRTDRLSQAEMKQLLRAITQSLTADYVRFPHREPTVVVEIVGYTGDLPREVRDFVETVIGDFQSKVLT